jgi:ATP-dependent helicase/nuclease subunit A
VPPRRLVVSRPAYAIDGRSVDRDMFYAVACDPARSVVVEACAGAGKTWMLVSRVVRALLDGTPPQHILAITFTKKAAGEMRQRLDEWLARFAVVDHAARVAELRARGVGAAEADRLAPRLGTLQAQLLDGARAVEVRTFHAWFAQLLRAAPLALLREVGLDAGRTLIEEPFEVAPELYRRFHAALLDDAALERDYVALVCEHGRGGVRRWLDAAWQRRVEVELADAAGTLDGSVEAATPDGSDPASQVRMLASPFQKLAAVLCARAHKVQRTQGEKLLDALALPDHRACIEALRGVLYRKDGEPRRLDAPTEDALAALDTLDALFLQHDAHVAHLRMARLVRVLLACYDALKRERGLADMADLERVALALLRDSALAGWVQQRLDAQVRQLLIDEFQDTSPLQWQALSAWLAGYAGAGGGAGAPALFIVGDPKQSIYRFRGAEPRVFGAARDFVRDALGGVLLACDHTRRNAPGVLDAVNRVFAPRLDGFREHTTEVAHDLVEPAARRLPSLERPARAPKVNATPLVWRDSLTVPRAEPDASFREHEGREVARAIAVLLSDGLPAGDMLVLARRRDALRHVADALCEQHMPHAAAEPVVLGELPEVRDLVAVLDVLASTRHDLSLAHALRSALFGIDDDTLLRLSHAARASAGWWAALQASDDAALRRARTLFARWAALGARLPPHDLLDMIVADGDFVARVAARVPAARRASALASIDALLALALELDGARYPTVYGFVRALKRRALEAVLTPPPGAVQLMTVHGAKGLEAPVVFIVDSDAETRPGETMGLLVDWPVDAAAPRRCAFVAAEARCPPSLGALLRQEQAARARESLNMLYVAMTRAERLLVLSRTEPRGAGYTAEDAWWGLAEPHLAPWSPGDDAPEPLAPPIVVPELPRWQPPAAPPALREEARSARIGSALHRVLEWAAHDDARLDDHLRAAAAQWALDAEGAADVGRHARAILASPPCRRFFDRAAYAWAGSEVPLAEGGEALRADRIVAFDDAKGAREWWLLDFKRHPAPHTQLDYVAQLQRYRDALRALQPRDSVRAAFISADGALIEPDLPA